MLTLFRGDRSAGPRRHSRWSIHWPWHSSTMSGETVRKRLWGGRLNLALGRNFTDYMHAITVRADEGGKDGGPKVTILPTWESFIDFNYKLIAEAKLNRAEVEVKTRERAIMHSPEHLAARQQHGSGAADEPGEGEATPSDRVDMGTWWGVPQTKAPWDNQKSIIQTGGGYSPIKVIKEENIERERLQLA